MENTVVSVSQLVALINQTLDFAYPVVLVEGEVSSFRISKNKWIYFDLKDEDSTVRFFGSVYNLKTPIEDGMMVKVVGNPRLHHLYGFSVTVQNIEPSGEGSIKRALDLLKAKLEKEGLFAGDRKRALPTYPSRIGLITSSQAAAFSDFKKIIDQRWGGLEIDLYDVQVQGEVAVEQIVEAVRYFSNQAEMVDVLVVIRGGGSQEDLAAFSAEPVVRAVASSRMPTVVGIGHESDISLAELAADMRASTPTNAAQIVVPDQNEFINNVDYLVAQMTKEFLDKPKLKLEELNQRLQLSSQNAVETTTNRLNFLNRSITLVNPRNVLKRGYSITRNSKGKVVSSANTLKPNDNLMIEFSQGSVTTEVKNVKK